MFLLEALCLYIGYLVLEGEKFKAGGRLRVWSTGFRDMAQEHTNCSRDVLWVCRG